MSKSVALLLVLVFLTASCLIVAEPALSSADVAENSWITKTSMPTAASVKAAVLNDKIYVIGVSCNYEYNPATDTWAVKKPMSTPRRSFGMAAFQNKIYVIGGITESGAATGANEVYDPFTDTWETKTPMPTNRSQLNANVVDGKIHLIGGRTGGQYSTVSLNEVYDPVNNSWNMKTPILYPVVSYASAVVDNKIYVIGGQAEFHDPMNAGFNQIYDAQTDTWSQGSTIPNPVWLGAVADATTGIMAPKRIYVMGGVEGLAAPSSKNYVYDPQADVWSAGASLPTPRTGLAVAVVNDLLYAIGGNNGWTTSYAQNEQYTPFGYGTVPPTVHVVSPENHTYTTSVSLVFSLNKPAVWMGYSLDGQETVTITGNTTLPELSSGLHSITVYAKDEFENTGASETITFSTAEPFPTTLVAVASGASAVAVGAGILVYFKKRKH